MKLSTTERKLLQTLASLANKLNGPSASFGQKRATRQRAGRSREESARMKAEILAAIKKGTPVREVAESHGVTPPYIYQIITKSKKGRKS